MNQISLPTPANCPFCRGFGAVAIDRMRAFVLCGRCGACGPTTTLTGYDDVAGICCAIDAWNRRWVEAVEIGVKEPVQLELPL